MTRPTPDAKSVFGRAAEIPSPAERAAFLDHACAGHPAVRAEVDTLLKAFGNAGAFMAEPAAPGSETASYHTPITEGEGTAIGPYTLREQIGEGGMGLVFVAEQTHPVRRKVALKVIKPGMDSRQVIARFEAERQALALMDHPNIAKVLDAGTTDAGRPYFVMELVKGVPITEWCDANHLTPKDRLGLFVQVCQAVQHAHQKGVIHRDLKPSNVLVTSHDGVPVPKVIDFGVAKAVGQSLTEKTIYTRFAQMIGTPLYMSPEQAEMSGLDVDTRSDVYALGVLLYELLTGTTPFDGERFRKAAYDEIRRIIKEEEPPRPSTRLTSLGATLTAVSAKRGTDPGKLAGVVRGELDWIVMRCLEKDRTRRYDGAATLAKDVQRYLTGDAVEACPPTLGYRLRKAYRRNKAAVLVGGAFAAVLLTAVIVSVTFGVSATRAGKVAESARQDANDQRDIAMRAGAEASAERDKTNAALGVVQTEQDRTRRLLYASHISHASMAFAEGRGGPLIRQLDEATPRPGEPDMRNWEWHFLDRQTRPDREYKVDISGWPKANISFGQNSSRSRDGLASRNGCWIVSRRAAGEGFVFEVHEAATGRHVGQVPKTGVLKHEPMNGLTHLPLLSEDGRHLLVTTTRFPTPFPERGRTPMEQPAPDSMTNPRLWEVASGREIGAPPGPMRTINGSQHLTTVVGGGGATWVAWMEPTTDNPSSRFGVKGPVKVSVARWEAATGKVTRKEVTVGTGWGMARLGSDGRSVYWYPMSERSAGMSVTGGSGSDPIEYGEFQRWDVDNPSKVQTQVRVPVSGGLGSAFVALSASWDMLAVLDRRQVTVHALSDGRIHWQAPVPSGFDTSGAMPLSGPHQGFTVSDDGNRVAFHASETIFVVERTASGKPSERRFGYRYRVDANGRFNIVRDFLLMPDGRTLVRQDFDTVRVWDITRGASDLKPPTGGGPQRMTDPDGSAWFVKRTANGGRTLKWSAPPAGDAPAEKNAPPRQLFVVDAEGKAQAKLDLAPPGVNESRWASRAVVFVDSDCRLLLKTIRPKDARPGLTYLSPPLRDLQGISDGTLGWTREWALYDLEKPGFDRVTGGSGDMVTIANSPYLLGITQPESVLDQPSSFAVYDGRTGSVVREFRPPQSARFLSVIPSRLIDPTGRRVVITTATGSKDDTAATVRVEVCEIATGKSLWSVELTDVQFHKQSANGRQSFQVGARFTPDGSRVIVDYQSPDGLQLGVWSAATGVLERTLVLTKGLEQTYRISNFAFAPDGRHVTVSLAASLGLPVTPNFLDVWNLDTGTLVQRLTGVAEGFGDITLSSDATRLFATDRTPPPGTPGRLHVWDVSTGRELLTHAIDYEPNPTNSVLSGFRYDAGKLYIEHPMWVRVLDGTPLPEPAK
jgi:serine/threonine protein kinase